MRKSAYALLLGLGIASLPALADIDTAKALESKYASIAKTVHPDFKGFSPDAGRAFYIREMTIRGKQVSCSSCHTDNPANVGKHKDTKKKIDALAPTANPKRFTSVDKVEKNFAKHCQDIIGLDCTVQEKGDFIAYLLTVK